MQRQIRKLVAFLVAFLGAYLCQILKEMNLISLGSFAFLVHVLIRELQDLDRMPIKKCSKRNFVFPATYKKSRLVHYQGDVLTRIDWALNFINSKPFQVFEKFQSRQLIWAFIHVSNFLGNVLYAILSIHTRCPYAILC